MILHAGTRRLDLRAPVVMGILNVTPDSFSDGGLHADPEVALAAARRMVAEGARIIDVGGESSRPGSVPPTIEEEIARVVPVVTAIAAELDVMISVDTSRAEVIRAVAAVGAHLINDVRGLRQPEALRAVAESGLAACVMHMQGEPRTMQVDPRYHDVLSEVRTWLAEQVDLSERAGIPRERILVDPGFGFGKTGEHNLALFQGLEAFTDLGVPLLVGVSRKSIVGQLTGRPVAERLAGSIAMAALAVERGAAIIRAHDVAATVDAVRIGAACRRTRGCQG
jgi:dihydropteroate synthase